jgi:hypothetical protein
VLEADARSVKTTGAAARAVRRSAERALRFARAPRPPAARNRQR